jgi:hypothetical protein
MKRPQICKLFWGILRNLKSKKTLILLSAIVLVIAGTVFGILAWKKYKADHNPANQPQVYEALVNIVDQKTSDPVEDARSSLKKGDVIAYFPAGHPWSETEKISYLIVKIKLRPDEAVKLTEAKTQPLKNPQLPKNPQGQNGAPKNIGPQTETVLARQYRMNLPSFDLQKFWSDHNQPFADKVFDAGIIQKK